MSGKLLTIEQILTMLAQTPPRLTALTDGLESAQLRTPPGQGEWSANEVLAHMRSCADVWGNCIVTIIGEDKPTLKAINPTTWIKKTNYLALEFQSSLRSFATQRAELGAILESLPLEDWSRSATVTGAGAPLERTVKFYAQWLARHEQPHIKQVQRIVNTVHG